MSRRSISLITVVLPVLMSMVGCQPQSMTPQAKAEMVKRFNEILANERKIEFRSWDGKWIGTDCDTDIIFLPGDVVEVIEYADGISRNRGTYQLDENGVLTLGLKGLEGLWPTLVLQKDSSSFFLRPKDVEVESKSNGRRWKGYWPFRVFR